jgi:hypothetical protein
MSEDAPSHNEFGLRFGAPVADMSDLCSPELRTAKSLPQQSRLSAQSAIVSSSNFHRMHHD